jgi:hypothetical protein
MELDELHVHQVGAGVIRHRLAVAGVFPTVAGDLVGASDAAGRDHHRFGAKQMEQAALPIVGEGSRNPGAILDQADDGELHEDVDALVDAVVLQGANHLQAGAVADVGQAGVAMAAEVALQDAAVVGAVEHRAPGLQFAHPVGRFLGVQFRHPPVVNVLSAAHGVGEVDLPAIAVVHVGQRRRHPAFGHHGVRLAQQGLADQPDFRAHRRGFDGGAQPGAARPDYQHVVLMGFVLDH